LATAPNWGKFIQRFWGDYVQHSHNEGHGRRNTIKVEGDDDWKERKHRGPKCRIWCKVHIAIDDETLEVRAVEATHSDIGDASMLPDLLTQIPADHHKASVTPEGPPDTQKCHDAIAETWSNVVIPPTKNAKQWKAITAGAVARNEALRASKYLGRAL
jgi:hypothetical protein